MCYDVVVMTDSNPTLGTTDRPLAVARLSVFLLNIKPAYGVLQPGFHQEGCSHLARSWSTRFRETLTNAGLSAFNNGANQEQSVHVCPEYGQIPRRSCIERARAQLCNIVLIRWCTVGPNNTPVLFLCRRVRTLSPSPFLSSFSLPP